jgi:hypothetical protein
VAHALRITLLALVGLVLAPSAQAGLLTTGSAAYCDPAASQPFARWGDTASYTLVPGGAFEVSDPAWSLRGGAATVAGNEPYYVHAAKDRRSLYLPAGSSATTPTTCFVLGDWHLRFFVRNRGTTSGSLRVEVVARSLVGVLSVLDGGTVRAGTTWAPSPRVGLLVSNLTSLLGTKAVAFRFTPVGTGAAFQIDDVYLDPWKSF